MVVIPHTHAGRCSPPNAFLPSLHSPTHPLRPHLFAPSPTRSARLRSAPLCRPYAYFEAGTAGTTGGIAGFGKDIAMGMGALCNLDITVVQVGEGEEKERREERSEEERGRQESEWIIGTNDHSHVLLSSSLIWTNNLQ